MCAGTGKPEIRLETLFDEAHVIAIVGLSTVPAKDSHGVGAYLQREGYTIVPIHPTARDILGERAYPTLSRLPKDLAATVDIVNIFRPSGEIPGFVDEVLQHLPHVKVIWLQVGIRHHEAAEKARAAGIPVIQDTCIRTQHMFHRLG